MEFAAGRRPFGTMARTLLPEPVCWPFRGGCLAMACLLLALAISGCQPAAAAAVKPEPGSSSSAGKYQPPIGIPAPPFGIEEVAPPHPAGWPQAEVPGYYYIDNTHPNATDNNSFGYPNMPRQTIPEITYPAGSYVEIHGGVYSDTNIRMEFNCTQAQPCWVRGTPGNMPKISGHIESNVNMAYVIFEYLDFDGGTGSALGAGGSGEYIAVRHSQIRNRAWAGNDAGVGFLPAEGKSMHDIVIYKNIFHDLGDWQTDADEDFQAVLPSLWGRNKNSGSEAYNFWILENICYHLSGDCVQVNAGWGEGAGDLLHHIYVGKNISYENRQTGYWSKQGRDIIFSQNVTYANRAHGDSGGAGIGSQYGPDNLWIIYNEVYDSEFGIQQAGTDGDGTHNVYIIGNVIHDNDAADMEPCGHWSSPSGWGISIWDASSQVHIVNNTIYNTRGGIELIGGNSRVVISNNIIADLNGIDYANEDPACGNLIVLPDKVEHLSTNNAANVSVDYNLFAQADSFPVRINGSESVADYRAGSGQCADCLQGNPLFVSAGTDIFSLQSTSPAVNTGVEANVYQTFLTLYGLDIRVDYAGQPRPQGMRWDIGAFEALSSLVHHYLPLLSAGSTR